MKEIVHNPSDRSNRNHTARFARRVVAGSMLAAALFSLTACSSDKHATEQATQKQPQSLHASDPLVVSGKAEFDTLAFKRSEDELGNGTYAKAEKLAPTPAWEYFGDKKRTTVKSGELVGADDTATTKPGEFSHGSTTQHAAAPTTQPEKPLADVDRTTLPVTQVELPDGKLRLIWALQNYGGSVIASTRDPNTSRRTVAITPADLAPLVSVVTAHLGAAGTCVALPKENTLVITCDKNMKDSVLDLLARVDVPARQVEITAKIFEVSQDFDFQQGANLLLNRVQANGTQSALSTFNSQAITNSATTGAPFNGSVIKLMQVFQDAGLSLDASFQLLADNGLIRVVSAPRMTVAAGQTGYLLAGQELPIQSANFVNNVLQTTTTYKPVGVQLYITPQAVGPDRVKLHTISIVSSVAGFAPLPTLTGQSGANTLINPIIDSREAETAVTINDGNTLVISGLRMIRTTTRENKVPGLGDIPVLGWMFKNHRSQQQMTDLYFFVTPTLM
jgi:type II secretory pathway component GspD/PulD (secretin)